MVRSLSGHADRKESLAPQAQNCISHSFSSIIYGDHQGSNIGKDQGTQAATAILLILFVIFMMQECVLGRESSVCVTQNIPQQSHALQLFQVISLSGTFQ